MGIPQVLDVGVFTGASTLSAALAVPDDGEVHSLDLNEEYVNIGKERGQREVGVLLCNDPVVIYRK